MLDKLKEVLSKVFGVSQNEFTMATTMRDVREWDSMNHIHAIVAIEEAFDVERFTMEEIVTMTSIEKMIEILSKKGVAQ